MYRDSSPKHPPGYRRTRELARVGREVRRYIKAVAARQKRRARNGSA
jgi:hypothetical protein